MKRSVRLFIGGMEVEFKTTPDILYNFQVDSLTNPSAVKNSYSKTVQIPGTSQNNRIFDNFFLNDYRTTANNFDASKKTEFTIYLDNDIYETGYCKLDSVSQNKHYWEYSVSLFGGLGSFIYSLAYSNNPTGDDEKRKLSDLEFYAGPDSDTPIDIGFEINKETINDAWQNIDGYSSKWHIINFAPAYNGLPQDFDADKVLMNVGTIQQPSTDSQGRPIRRPGGRGSVVTTSVTQDGVTYQTYGGYALATLSREYTQPEMREFRSYLMRPVLNVQRTIEAMCRPEQNGGYEVELDQDFFYYDNPYWADMWMTLPMLSSLEYTTSVVASGVTAYLTGGSASGNTTTGDPGYYRDFLTAISEADSGMAYDVNVKVNLFANGVSNNAQDSLVLCAYSSKYNFHHASAIFVQLVAYDAFGNPVAGSDVHYITSSYGARRTQRMGYNTIAAYFLDANDWQYTPPYGNGYVSSKGSYFNKVSGNTYMWNEDISLTAQNVPAGSTLKVLVTKVYKAGGTQNGPKYLFYRHSEGGELTRYSAYTFNDFSVQIKSSTVAFKSNEGIRTGAAFSKGQILNTDFSCADFLLSYCKIFGLYLLKDPVEKKIEILTRKNFFKRNEIVDIDHLIDRQSLKITPLVFDSKWYDWNLDADESEYGKAYENTYGKKYGQQKINTGYNFNKTTKEVFDDNVFKGAVQVLERSNAFCFTGQDTTSKPWMFPGYSYLLYDTSDNTNTYEVTVNPSSTIDAYSAFTTGYMYYDLFDKVQLHTADNSPADGTNVLLMRSGNKALTVGSVNLNYYITDDNSYMNILNDGRPCWLFTNNETDAMGNSLAKRVTSVPYFSRYKISDGNGYILRSLDFGKPAELYIPNAVYRQGSTIYEAFWQSYISDLYSKDSRVVKTKMLIRETPTVDWLRRFYLFDSAVWRMVNIKDYNVGVEKLTEVEFVKVQDVNNYTSEVISSIPQITLTLSTDQVGPTGGTVTYTVTVSDGGAWYIENDGWNISSLSASAGTGDYTGTWTINPNSSTFEQNLTLTAFADNASARATVTLKAYTVTLERVDSGDISWSGGSATFKVISTESPWSAKTDYTGIITAITPSQGSATDSGGTTITVSFAPNEYTSSRYAWIYVELPNGQTARSGYINQSPLNNAGISVSPSSVSSVAASGSQYTLAVYSTEDWYGLVTYSDRIEISPTSGASGYTEITMTVFPNTGDSRYAQAYFYRDSSLNNPAVLTVWQNAYELLYFYFGTSPTDSASTSAVTVGWYGSTNVVNAKTNADTIYYSVSGAPWITEVVTGATQQLVSTVTNGMDEDRVGYVLFGLSADTLDKVLTVTQGHLPESGGTVDEPLYITRLSGSGDWDLHMTGFNSGATIEIKTGNTWEAITATGMSITATIPDSVSTVYVRGNVNDYWFNTNVDAVRATGSSVTLYEVGGNEMSYYYGSGFASVTASTKSLHFEDDTKLYSARNLWAIGPGDEKFNGCTNLVNPPDILPATEPLTGISYGWYQGMFRGCTSLTTIPVIKLNSNPNNEWYLFRGMFENCTSLTDLSGFSVPLAGYASYYQMFKGCTSLTKSPKLGDGSVISVSAFTETFSGCTSLTEATINLLDNSSNDASRTMYNAFVGVNSTGTVYTKLSSNYLQQYRTWIKLPNTWNIVALE